MAKKMELKQVYRCQFCGKDSPVKEWKDDKCPECKKAYNPQLAQDSEE